MEEVTKMTFENYRRLKKLVLRSPTLADFWQGVLKWPRRYAVVSPVNWTRAHYEDFYAKIKGGQNYASLFGQRASV
jgi:hypothetical protein